MNLQHIQIKIFASAPASLNLDPFLAIFARWRKEKDHPAQWVDLADYAHMLRGPGVVLVGQLCNFSFDLAPPQPGILYYARKGLSGSPQERISSAFRSCFELSKRLVAEKEYPPSAPLQTDRIAIRFSDRLDIPNTTSTDKELRPPVVEVLNALFGPQGYELSPQSDPAECYGFFVKAKKAEPLNILLDRMASATKA